MYESLGISTRELNFQLMPKLVIRSVTRTSNGTKPWRVIRLSLIVVIWFPRLY
jgi:hypothetical protein